MIAVAPLRLAGMADGKSLGSREVKKMARLKLPGYFFRRAPLMFCAKASANAGAT